jgi:hypothetical protein
MNSPRQQVCFTAIKIRHFPSQILLNSSVDIKVVLHNDTNKFSHILRGYIINFSASNGDRSSILTRQFGLRQVFSQSEQQIVPQNVIILQNAHFLTFLYP